MNDSTTTITDEDIIEDETDLLPIDGVADGIDDFVDEEDDGLEDFDFGDDEVDVDAEIEDIEE